MFNTHIDAGRVAKGKWGVVAVGADTQLYLSISTKAAEVVRQVTLSLCRSLDEGQLIEAQSIGDECCEDLRETE